MPKTVSATVAEFATCDEVFAAMDACMRGEHLISGETVLMDLQAHTHKADCECEICLGYRAARADLRHAWKVRERARKELAELKRGWPDPESWRGEKDTLREILGEEAS